MTKTNIYIDGNNLHRAAKLLGFSIDYYKFRVWLTQKFNTRNMYLFIGYLSVYETLYKYLKECGFTLVFKETIEIEGVTKGNCDPELILKVVCDFYTKDYDTCILISGDGDFASLVDFLVKEKVLHSIIAPHEKRCSFLLRNKNVDILFLNNHYHKFSQVLNKKAPDADSSA